MNSVLHYKSLIVYSDKLANYILAKLLKIFADYFLNYFLSLIK